MDWVTAGAARSVGCVVVLVGAAAGGRARRRWRARRRAAALLGDERPSRRGRVGGRRPRRRPTARGSPVLPGWLRRAAKALVTGLGAAVFLGGTAGLVAGGLLTVGLYRWLPRARSPTERRAELDGARLVRQLPLTAELLAACLGSAASPAEAVAAVGRSVGAPMGPRLLSTAAELALGAPPELCWQRLGKEHPPLAPLARCLVRTSLSGAPAATALAGLASGQRAEAVRAAHARVRRAGVLATAPLGLCFLPAFVLIGVAPVVVGLTTRFSQSM
ncbi:type II secretion system F family protein [Kitasatospora sp. NPDC094019]|uniref:type II secretion system F family protein n=1 Tax=Kitasatospora sp. NPDC094019 TaxID=3364091 RepID=UPI00381CD54A